jgi:hypothetical protein
VTQVVVPLSKVQLVLFTADAVPGSAKPTVTRADAAKTAAILRSFLRIPTSFGVVTAVDAAYYENVYPCLRLLWPHQAIT